MKNPGNPKRDIKVRRIETPEERSEAITRASLSELQAASTPYDGVSKDLEGSVYQSMDDYLLKRPWTHNYIDYYQHMDQHKPYLKRPQSGHEGEWIDALLRKAMTAFKK